MKQIALESIYLHNFKSFINPTLIEFSQNSGLKFLGGKNLMEPRLGSNGSGKSSIWDGFTWCLTGVGVRGQKASDLTSWGEKQPQVIVNLQIDGAATSIDRTGSPNRLAINGVPSTQEDVERLIGLSRDRLLQSVLFGQAVPLFLDLSTAARGELLDSVLDLRLWMDLSEAAGRQATSLSQQVTAYDQTLSFERGKLAALEDENRLREQSVAWQASHDAEIDKFIQRIEDTEGQIADTTKEIAKLKAFVPADLEPIEADILAVKTRLADLADIEKTIHLYRTNRECPTCHQSLGSHMASAQDYIAILEEELHRGLTRGEAAKRLEELREEKAECQQEKVNISNSITRLESEVTSHNKYIRMMVQHVDQLGLNLNPYTARLIEIQKTRTELAATIENLTTKQMETKGELHKVEYWKTGFKKVRLFQVKQVLSRLEIETANAASALGISGWKIRYVTEVENKSGSFKQGIQVLVSTPKYDGRWELYSGGEAQRIRLAVTLGLATLIQNMAGVNYQLEVWDEASHYLSIEGVEDLLTCLSDRADITKKSIWVTDHTALSFGGFSEMWCCEKSSSGSSLNLLTQSN